MWKIITRSKSSSSYLNPTTHITENMAPFTIKICGIVNVNDILTLSNLIILNSKWMIILIRILTNIGANLHDFSSES